MKCRIHPNRDAVKLRPSWFVENKPYAICETCADEFMKIGTDKVLGPLMVIPLEMEEKYQFSLEPSEVAKSKLRGKKMK